jgi:hypothetical protein
MFQKAIHYPLANSKKELIAICNESYLHADTYYHFKISKKKLHKQLTHYKQQTKQTTRTKNQPNKLIISNYNVNHGVDNYINISNFFHQPLANVSPRHFSRLLGTI